MQQSQLVGLMLSKIEDLEKQKKKNKHPKNSNKKKTTPKPKTTDSLGTAEI